MIPAADMPSAHPPIPHNQSHDPFRGHAICASTHSSRPDPCPPSWARLLLAPRFLPRPLPQQSRRKRYCSDLCLHYTHSILSSSEHHPLPHVGSLNPSRLPLPHYSPWRFHHPFPPHQNGSNQRAYPFTYQPSLVTHISPHHSYPVLITGYFNLIEPLEPSSLAPKYTTLVHPSIVDTHYRVS